MFNNQNLILSLKDSIAVITGLQAIQASELVECHRNYGLALNLQMSFVDVVFLTDFNLKSGKILDNKIRMQINHYPKVDKLTKKSQIPCNILQTDLIFPTKNIIVIFIAKEYTFIITINNFYLYNNINNSITIKNIFVIENPVTNRFFYNKYEMHKKIYDYLMVNNYITITYSKQIKTQKILIKKLYFAILLSYINFNTIYINNLTDEKNIIIEKLFQEILYRMEDTDEFVNNHYDSDTDTYNCTDLIIN